MRKKPPLLTNHIDESLDKRFRSLKIRNYTILQRADGLNIVMRFFMHLHSPVTYCYNFSRIPVDGHYGRLVYNNLFVLYYKGIGCAKVDCQLLRKKIK